MSDDDKEEEGGGGLDAESLRSFVTFIKRALRMNRTRGLMVFGIGVVLTTVAANFFPRSFECRTTLLAEGNEVLDGRWRGNSLTGAGSLIFRHENLEAIIRDIGLVEKFRQRRPPLHRLKDKIFAALFGAPKAENMASSMVGTLEKKLSVEVESGELNITVEWSDGQTAAEIAEAARESFVRARHSAEMSAFEEKLGILDGHAKKVRDEVEELAAQLRAKHDSKVAQLQQLSSATASARPVAVPAPVGAVAATVRRSGGGGAALPDPDLPGLKERFETSKRKLAELEGERERHLRDEQAKLNDMKLRLAPSHPDVITAERRMQMLWQEPSELALLRAETKSLEAQVRGRETMSQRPGSFIAGVRGTDPKDPLAVDALPPDLGKLLEADDVDPTQATQLRGAVTHYGGLREDIRSGRIDLDTAQAAFNHRYKVIVPAEAPKMPTKPKLAVIIGGGLFASLLFGLLVPILLELRKGVVVARWQVSMIELPILAELKLPPHRPGPPSEPPRLP